MLHDHWFSQLNQIHSGDRIQGILGVADKAEFRINLQGVLKPAVFLTHLISGSRPMRMGTISSFLALLVIRTFDAFHSKRRLQVG